MNTKNNRRHRESVAIIEKEFVELLKTKQLDEISVTELCKRSGLNRSTFYAYFSDVYELADRMRKNLETEVAALYDNESIQEACISDFLRLLRHIRDNQLFYQTYFKLGYDDEHRVELYDMRLAERCFKNEYIDYHIEFFRSGFNAIVKMWLAGGCRETPEEIEGILRAEYQGRYPNA